MNKTLAEYLLKEDMHIGTAVKIVGCVHQYVPLPELNTVHRVTGTTEYHVILSNGKAYTPSCLKKVDMVEIRIVAEDNGMYVVRVRVGDEMLEETLTKKQLLYFSRRQAFAEMIAKI